MHNRSGPGPRVTAPLDHTGVRVPSLGELAEATVACRACVAADADSGVVLGDGAPDADLLLVGDVPGRPDTVLGRPFSGAVGNVLDHALERAGLRREDCYVTTVVKCGGPTCATPRPGLLEDAGAAFAAEVRAVGPRVVVALGAATAGFLLGHPVPLRRIAEFRAPLADGITLIPTFHPRDTLKANTEAGVRIARDLQVARAVLEGRLPSGAATLARARAQRGAAS